MSAYPQPTVVAPGNYDGVHRGHQALLAAARSRAQERSARALALFFDPHPAVVLAPERAPAQLTTSARRTELLRAMGADDVVVQRFDLAFAALSPEAFVEDVLRAELGACTVVVGPDFRFGRGRAGDVRVLEALGQPHGLTVELVPAVHEGGQPISSTRVRQALQDGDARGAARLLGRVHDVDGTVTRGAGRGRDLGFRTANLQCSPVLLPSDGVYAVCARVLGGSAGERWWGVANLGNRPTFEAQRAVEVHLLDFDGDLYGRALRVGFVRRLRAEQKFADAQALRTQIEKDIAEAREVFETVEPTWLRWL